MQIHEATLALTCPIAPYQYAVLLKDGLALLGCLGGLIFWRRLDTSYRLIALWLGFTAAINLTSMRVGCGDEPARFLVLQFWFPLSAPLLLNALGAYQGTVTRRDIFRFMGLGYVFAWATMLPTIEHLDGSPRYTSEIHTLLVLLGACITLVRRASLARQDLRNDPGFVLSAAILLFAVPTYFIAAITRSWGTDHVDWVHRYFVVHAIISAIAYAWMIRGMQITIRKTKTGWTR